MRTHETETASPSCNNAPRQQYPTDLSTPGQSPRNPETTPSSNNTHKPHCLSPLTTKPKDRTSAWDAKLREAYANDQDSPDTLITVTAASNRSKADKDPAEWLPSDASYHCAYAATWVGTKLRWNLAADEAERDALLGLAEDCPTTVVTYEPAP
ncbi:GmrSD restriction endonuclease domain-containing protein [Streptomyces hydrogenans]